MEHLIESYLEAFSKIPRNTLYDRRKRQAMVDYIILLVKGQDGDVEKLTRESVLALLSYHQRHCNENGEICKMGKYHNILYVALKLAYQWHLNDTGIITILLQDIYKCEQSFERVQIGAILGMNGLQHFLSGWKCDFDSEEENYQALIYLIEHANKGMLSFGDSKRFIDVTLECIGQCTITKLAASLAFPEKLHFFLRYGANVDYLAEDLLEILCKLPRESHPYKLTKCLRLINRVILKVDIRVNRKDIGNTNGERILIRYQNLIDDEILPLNRCGIKSVPTLKHLCRFDIRKILWQNFQLPNGICCLNIPDCLKNYLDIMED